MVEIYVALIGEGVDVWRPVQAEHLGHDLYRIAEQPYERETETWQFEPGDEVSCQPVKTGDGTKILAAIARS